MPVRLDHQELFMAAWRCQSIGADAAEDHIYDRRKMPQLSLTTFASRDSDAAPS